MADLRLRRLWHLGVRLRVSLGLEHRVPPKVSRAARWDDLTGHSAVECDDVGAGAGTKGKDCLRVRRLVVVGSEQVVETNVAGLLEEPFYVWPWEAVERVEAERSILCDDRAANLRGGKLALFRRDLVGLALQLRQVDLLIGEREGQAACITATALGEEELDLLELLGVAGDKCDQPRKKSVGTTRAKFRLVSQENA